MSAKIKVTLKAKRCVRCREIKPVGEFYSHPSRRDGLQSWCKCCCKKRAAQTRRELGNPQSEFGPEHRAKWAEIARQNAAESTS